MTDSISHLTVVLDEDIREDDVEAIIAAIHMMRYVASVTPGKPVDPTDHVARARLRNEMRGKVLGLFDQS